MGKDKENKKEAEYSPEYFIDDLGNLLSSFMNKIEVMKEIEFTLKQRSQIAGMMMGVASAFNKIHDQLKEWGFMS